MSDKEAVVLIDDSAVIKVLTTKLFKELYPQYEIYPFSSGEEALDGIFMIPESIFLVLVDYNMGGMNGIEFIQKIEGKILAERIYLLTANIQNPVQEKALKINIGFIEKPLTQEKLQPVVTKTQLLAKK